MEEIKYGFNSDIATDKLKDIVPERMVKVYPYEFVNASKSEAFIQQNSVSVVAMSQYGFDDPKGFLKEDENGKYYFEVFVSFTSDSINTISAQTSIFGQEIREENTYTCLSNWYYNGELSGIMKGNSKVLPAAFTVGKPFVKDEYEDGTQTVYLSTTMTEAMEFDGDSNDFALDEEGLYEFQLSNISNLESSFTNARIILHEDRINLSDINNFTITVPPTILIDKLKVKGKQLGSNNDIDFITKTPSAKLKISPISTQDKLSIFIDCFDANVHLPKEIAEKAVNPTNLKDFGSSVGIPDSLVTLITDMFLYVTEFSKRFGQVPRNNDGQIDKDWKIGSEQDYLSGITGQDVDTVIDGLYRNWRTKYPSLVGGDGEKIFKEFIAAMSDYFSGNLAIGKGQSSYHQNYLLWYFELVSPVNAEVSIHDKTVSLKAENIRFKLASKYYDIKSGHLVPKEDENISEISLIETDRKITLPEFPEIITEIDKLSLPGDINTTSSNDLMYFVNLFLDENEISSFFSGVSQNAIGLTEGTWENQQLVERNQKYTASEADAFIKAQIKQAYPDAVDIHKVKGGESSPVDDAGKYTIRAFNLKSDFSTSSSNVNQKDTGFEQYLVKKHTRSPGRGISPRWGSSFNSDTLKSEVASYYKVEESDVRIESFNVGSGRETLTYSFYIIKYTWINYQYTFKSNRIIAKLSEKATVYDKAKWKELIKTAYNPATQWERKITLQEKYGITEFSIDEIILSSIFGEELELNFKNYNITIPLFNKDDETLAVQRILFT